MIERVQSNYELINCFIRRKKVQIYFSPKTYKDVLYKSYAPCFFPKKVDGSRSNFQTGLHEKQTPKQATVCFPPVTAQLGVEDEDHWPLSSAPPPPHRTPPAGPNPVRLAPLVICVERRNGSQRDGATSHGGTTSVVTTPRRCVWSRVAPRPSGIPILSSSASTSGLLQRLVSVVWHQSPREKRMVALSAGALAPLAGCNRSSLTSPPWCIVFLGCLVRYSSPNSFRSQVCLRCRRAARLRCTAAGVRHFSRCCIINGSNQLRAISICRQFTCFTF